MTRELLKQALEALQLCANGEDDVLLTRDALSALRQALGQPVQAQEHKPIAWMTEYGNVMHVSTCVEWVEFDGGRGCERFADYVIPLYVKPPTRQWVGLTTEQKIGIWEEYSRSTHSIIPTPEDLFKVVEALLKEKNT